MKNMPITQLTEVMVLGSPDSGSRNVTRLRGLVDPVSVHVVACISFDVRSGGLEDLVESPRPEFSMRALRSALSPGFPV
jgi:hypothetical protein